MSRAFTKEDDAGDDILERPVPAGPNYVTQRGLDLLKADVHKLAADKAKIQKAGGDAKLIDRDLRYLEARINSATVVPLGSGDEIRFGATVTIETETGEQQTFQIVGEDEARTGKNSLAWSAPIVIAMLGAKPGDTVTWDGPEATVRTKILKVSFLSDPGLVSNK